MPQNFLATPIISGMRKAKNLKSCCYILGPSKQSPLKILEKRERGHIQEMSKFLGYSLLSQEQVELQILYAHSEDRSQQKPAKNVGKSCHGCCQGLQKFPGHPCIYQAHHVIIFVIAQLSCSALYGSHEFTYPKYVIVNRCFIH